MTPSHDPNLAPGGARERALNLVQAASGGLLAVFSLDRVVVSA